jgi:hypothetical protein
MPYFRTDSGEHIEITKAQVLEGMRKFDEIAVPEELSRTGLQLFVEHAGKQYPPKWVVSLATGVVKKRIRRRKKCE